MFHGNGFTMVGISCLFLTALIFSAATSLAQPTCSGNSPDDTMVQVGQWCVDAYEASVWDSSDGTGNQYGAAGDDYPCQDNGQDCTGIYAVSRAGVLPSRSITWFQAQQACLRAGKELLPNAIWQAAAAGTPDSSACNIRSDGVANTGSGKACISLWGAHDMVGNVWEWVADWVQGNGATGGNWASENGRAGSDYQDDGIFGFNPAQFQGSGSADFPAALHRGGGFGDAAGEAGVFALSARVAPSFSYGDIGFRCGRVGIRSDLMNSAD